jgi:hypothetical protein
MKACLMWELQLSQDSAANYSNLLIVVLFQVKNLGMVYLITNFIRL